LLARVWAALFLCHCALCVVLALKAKLPAQPQSTEVLLQETDPPDAKHEQNEEQPAQVAPDMQLPREVIQRLKDAVFGFDTFFVTGTENYEANGVLFQGNLRGDPKVAYPKMNSRLQAELGDAYSLFLLQDQKENPVVRCAQGAGWTCSAHRSAHMRNARQRCGMQHTAVRRRSHKRTVHMHNGHATSTGCQ
jgi:hypothetical protein